MAAALPFLMGSEDVS